MWRSSLYVGMLTGAVFSLGFVMTPIPYHPRERDSVAGIRSAWYRMAGTVQRNTCAFDTPPWPDQWHVSEAGLRVGDRALVGRRMRSAFIYEATQVASDGCLQATWTIKLAPLGSGVQGSAAWELAPVEDSVCSSYEAGPCTIEAEVYGLPEQHAYLD